MEDVLLDILKLLDFVLAFLGQNWKGHRVKHNKDKPCVSDVLIELLGDVCSTCFMFFLSTPRRL